MIQISALTNVMTALCSFFVCVCVWCACMCVCVRARAVMLWHCRSQLFLWLFIVCAVSALLLYPIFFDHDGHSRYSSFENNDGYGFKEYVLTTPLLCGELGYIRHARHTGSRATKPCCTNDTRDTRRVACLSPDVQTRATRVGLHATKPCCTHEK